MAEIRLVILLHGVGSNGANLAPLGDLFRTALPEAAFAAPDGPLPFGRGPGRQWFSVDGITEANRPNRIAAARAGFDAILRDIIAAQNLAESLEKVALVGFSQGSIMALDALASGRWPLGAVVAFSGRLATPDPLRPSPATRTLIVHGDADPVMPAKESYLALDRLQAAGATAELAVLPGVGHTISGEGAALARDFLAAR